ncbi:hypothetical protein AVL63_12770 [Nesterenkonia jeotgali]|uniref:DNA-binding phage zinc finger domain-containing protein n=2 Tax=Nesterenkonia jeotgali TaxID=317018 RepID=A0A0W8IC53_9MICC|nr:hypothetical protein AVL63_12770 [Nesterenkonia jeotgali]
MQEAMKTASTLAYPPNMEAITQTSAAVDVALRNSLQGVSALSDASESISRQVRNAFDPIGAQSALQQLVSSESFTRQLTAIGNIGQSLGVVAEAIDKSGIAHSVQVMTDTLSQASRTLHATQNGIDTARLVRSVQAVSDAFSSTDYYKDVFSQWDPVEPLRRVLESTSFVRDYGPLMAGVAEPLMSEHAKLQLRLSFLDGIEQDDLEELALTPATEQEFEATTEDYLEGSLRGLFWRYLFEGLRWNEEERPQWVDRLSRRGRLVLVNRLAAWVEAVPALMFLFAGPEAWLLSQALIGVAKTRDADEQRALASPVEQALNRPCSFCGAKPGQACVTTRGRNPGAVARYTHRERSR